MENNIQWNGNGQVAGKPFIESADAPVVIDIEDENMQVEIIERGEDRMDTDALMENLDDEIEIVPDSQDDEVEGLAAPAAGDSNSTRLGMEETKLKKMLQIEDEQLAKLKTFTTFSDSEKLFPDVRVSEFHSVLFQLPPSGTPSERCNPRESRENGSRIDKVPLPCDPEDKVTVKVPTDDEVFEKVPVWNIIRRSFHDRVFKSSQDIENAIGYYFKTLPTLNVLHYTIDQVMNEDERNKFFSKVLPSMVKYCLRLPDLIACDLPFLRRLRNYSISLHQAQIASLLANAFFSTFNVRTHESAYPSINFYKLFSCDRENPKFVSRANKIRCILHYFERIADEEPSGVVTFTRKSMKSDKVPSWDKSDKKIRNLVVLCDGTIEDAGRGMLQVDFANKFVGGGVLGGGAVQEEILFVIYPELLVSRLFTEKLADAEALVVTGCERFCSYTGYASGFKFAGAYHDTTPLDPRRRRRTQIIAIDALYITRPITQYHPKSLVRELNKAYVGFNAPIRPPSAAVGTGKWGCGAFNGDPQLKGIIQMLAASQADKDMVYFTFGDMVLQECLVDMFAVIKDMSVGQVWNLLKQYHQLFCTSGNPSHSLSEFFQEYFRSTLPLSEDDDNMEAWGEGTATAQSTAPRHMRSESEPAENSLNYSAVKTPANRLPQQTSDSASAPSPAATMSSMSILGNVEKSKKFNNWLSSLDDFKTSMNRNKKKKELFSFESPGPLGGSSLTDDQILNMLEVEGDDEETNALQATNMPTPDPGSSSSLLAGNSKRRSRQDGEESSVPDSSKKVASTNSKLQHLYKNQ